MKTLTVNLFFSHFGGAEVIAYNTYKLLQEKGHDVYFFATNKQPYFESDYTYAKYFPKYNKSYFDLLIHPTRYYWNKEAQNNIKKMIQEIKPDIIHCHSLHWLTYSVIEPCTELNIPVIQTLHDAAFLCPVTTLLKNNKNFCEEKNCKKGNYTQCIINNCDRRGIEASTRLALFQYTALKTGAYRKISKFITPSEALKQLIIEANLGIEEDRIIAVNNFLEDSFIQTPVDYSNKGYFLFSGRLSEEKGVQYLLKAAKKLPKEIEFHIAGSGPLEEDFKQFAKDNDLNNVKFLGFMQRDKLLDEYKNCIAGIHPCNWFENFPTSNMEFFALGKPVIGSKMGGIPEQIEHEKTGLLFEPKNVDELAECILKMYKNPDFAIELGKNAKQKALAQYSKDRYYKELLQIYESVI